MSHAKTHGSTMTNPHYMGESIRMNFPRLTDCLTQCIAEKIIARNWLYGHKLIAAGFFQLFLQSLFVNGFC